MPEEVQKTVLTIEDTEFYRHNGVNVSSGLRSMATNLSAGGVEQGGSTITQQLVKNSITGVEQTLERKIREAILALRLEDQMSKDEILERYLNTVYLGHGAYGVAGGRRDLLQHECRPVGMGRGIVAHLADPQPGRLRPDRVSEAVEAAPRPGGGTTRCHRQDHRRNGLADQRRPTADIGGPEDDQGVAGPARGW